MRPSYILPLSFALFLFVCGCSKPDPHKEVRSAALQYYSLLCGSDSAQDVAGFVSGIVWSDSFPPTYRRQLEHTMAQFVRKQQRRGGIARVEATRDTLSDTIATVFLNLVFGDSTLEEVCVPMVKTQGQWYMQ